MQSGLFELQNCLILQVSRNNDFYTAMEKKCGERTLVAYVLVVIYNIPLCHRNSHRLNVPVQPVDTFTDTGFRSCTLGRRMFVQRLSSRQVCSRSYVGIKCGVSGISAFSTDTSENIIVISIRVSIDRLNCCISSLFSRSSFQISCSTD